MFNCLLAALENRFEMVDGVGEGGRYLDVLLSWLGVICV